MTSPTLPLSQVKAVTLIAHEEPLAPLGQPRQSDRPIAFAAVFLQLENPDDRVQWLTLEKVQVIDATPTAPNHRAGSAEPAEPAIYLASEAPQTVKLMPQERATLDIQLSSPKGYGEPGERPNAVKAIATYRIHETRYSAESPPVPIQ